MLLLSWLNLHKTPRLQYQEIGAISILDRMLQVLIAVQFTSFEGERIPVTLSLRDIVFKKRI